MTSRLHEGMTRTQSPPGSGSPLRVAALTALCAATLLILGWTIFSPTSGTGEHQAQAQTPAPEESPSGASGEGEDEPSYEAFGERRSNLFTPVVSLANEEGSENEDSNDDSANGDDQVSRQGTGEEDLDSDSSPNGTSTGNDNGSLSGDDENASQGTTSSAPPANGGAAGSSGAGNVDCQNPEDDFEELLCEEGAGGSTDDRTDSAQPGGRGEIEDDRDGGSGRSGAGEPTDTFRNGGPAPGK